LPVTQALTQRLSILGVADSRYEPISLGIGTSFKFLRNHTAIQQRPAGRCNRARRSDEWPQWEIGGTCNWRSYVGPDGRW